MASSVSIDVDSEVEQDTGLQFQDIPHDKQWKPLEEKQGGQPPGKTHTFTNFPHSAADSDDEDDSEKTEFLKEKKNVSFWTFEYYQQFFDVETRQVGGRILGSMFPRPGRNYLETHIRPNPDLYGPFWICTTLVFTTAVAGNLANYIQAAGQNYHWVYDFHKVTFAATAIFSYWWVIPFILFGLLWWRGNSERYTFLELICVYGYSLAVYIPISLLWVIPLEWLQWLLVVIGAVLSGSALLLTVWPAVRDDKKQIAIAVMVMIFLLHAALAMGFMLYFFHVPSKQSGASTVSPANVTAIPPVPHITDIHPHQVKQDVLQNLQEPAIKQGHNIIQDAAGQQNNNVPNNVNQAGAGQQKVDQDAAGQQNNNVPNNINQAGAGQQKVDQVAAGQEKNGAQQNGAQQQPKQSQMGVQNSGTKMEEMGQNVEPKRPLLADQMSVQR